MSIHTAFNIPVPPKCMNMSNTEKYRRDPAKSVYGSEMRSE